MRKWQSMLRKALCNIVIRILFVLVKKKLKVLLSSVDLLQSFIAVIFTCDHVDKCILLFGEYAEMHT